MLKQLLRLVLLGAMMVVPWAVKAQSSFTIGTGTEENDAIPVYSTYGDAITHSQYVIPASMLSQALNKQITSLKWYGDVADTGCGTSTMTWTVKVGTSTNSTLSDYVSTTGFTTVYSGALVTASDSTLTVTFTTPFFYSGGNLVVDVSNPIGDDYVVINWFGMSQSSSSYGGYDFDDDDYYYDSFDFLPKTTITFLDTSACPAPYNLAASEVLTDSVTLTWSEAGTATQWVVQFDTVTFTPGDSTLAGIVVNTTPSYTFSGLTPSTDYYFAVYAVCDSGLTSAATMLTVRTADTGSGNLILYSDFEEAGNNGFTLVNGSQGNKWFIGSATNNGGSQSLYISQDNGASNTYNIGSPTFVYATAQVDIADTGEYAYSFDWKCYGEGSYDYLRAWLVPGTPTVTAGQAPDGSTSSYSYISTSPAGWISLDGGTKMNLQTNWVNRAGTFVLTTPGTYTLVFMWANDGSAGTNPPGAIDNVMLSLLTCPQVADLTVTGLASDSVALTWTAIGSESQWLVTDGSTSVLVSTNSYTFSGLLSNTQYTFGVQAVCGPGDSSFVTSIQVRTPCPPMDSLPFIETFETVPTGGSTSTTFVDCWTRLNNGTTYFGYPYVSSNALYNHTPDGSRGLYWYNTTTTGTYGDYQCIVLPGFNTDNYDINDLRLTFWARASATSYSPTFQVGVMTNPNDINTFELVQTVNVGNSAQWDKYSVSLESYAGTGYYVALRANRSTMWYAYVDDISLELTPECPEVRNIAISHVNTDSAVVTWTEMGDATSWTITYVPQGLSPDSGITVVATSMSYTLLGLSSNTAYDVYVTPVCPGLTYTESASFRTQCDLLDTLPIVMGFEASEGVTTGSTTSATFVECWNRLNNGSTYFGYPYVANNATYNHTPGGSRGLYWYNTTTTGTYGDYQIVVLPGIDTSIYPINSLLLTFWARSSAASYLPVFLVGVMTDPGDPNTFQTVRTVSVNSTEFTRFDIPLSSFAGSGAYVAIRANRGASWYAYVDDITLDVMPSCPFITQMNVDAATSSAAMLSWEYLQGTIEEPTSFELLYDSINGSGYTSAISADPYYSLTYLEPGTTYKAIVHAVCDGGYGLSDTITFATLPLACAEMDPTTTDTIIVGASGTTTSYYVPIGNFYNYSYTQQLYTPTDLGLTASATITGIDFQYAYSSPSTSKSNCTIYLANTTVANLSSNFVPYSGVFTKVYEGSMNCSTGWNHFDFDDPFVYDGSSNLLVVIHDNSGGYNGTSYTFYCHSASNMARYVQNDGSAYNISTVSGGSVVATRPNIKIYTGDCVRLSSCAAPALRVVGTDTASVDLAWLPGYQEDLWDIDYRVVGSSAWTAEASGVATTTYTVTGLQPSTTYEFRLSHTCDTSVYAAYASAATNCRPEPVPFTEGFEGWVASTSGTVPSPCWYKATNYSTSYYPYVSTTAHQGSHSMYMYTYTYSYYAYFVLPPMQPSLDSLMASFWVYKSSSSYPDAKLQVGVISDPTDFTTFVPVGEVKPVYGEGWVQYDVMFNRYTGPAGQIAFAVPVQGSNASYTYFYVDDIEVDYIPSCPRISNLRATYVSGDTIEMAWTPGGSESEWEVFDGSNYYYTSDSNITLTGVHPNYLYNITVRAICDADDSSRAFSTDVYAACGNLDSLPYIEDFETRPLGSNTSANFIPCWGHLNNGTNMGYPYISSSTTYNHTAGGSRGLYWYYSQTPSTYGDYQVIVLPGVDTTVFPTNNLQLSFWAKPSSTIYAPVLYVGIMSDPNDISTFTYYDTIMIDHSSTDWKLYEVFFDRLENTVYGNHVAIRANVPTSYWYAYVDDITLDIIPVCPAVRDLVVEAGPASATVAWRVMGGNYLGATVEYKETSSDSWTPVSVSGVNYASITGLDPFTYYDLRVTANCSEESSRSLSTTFCTALYDCSVYDSTSLIDTVVGNGTSTNSYLPSYSFYNYGYSQQFFTAHELGGSGVLSKIAVFPTAVTQQRTYEIYMGYSSDSSASSFITPTLMTCVYNEGYIQMEPNQWLEFELTTPFNYIADSGNLVVIFRDITGTYVSGNAFRSHAAWTDVSRYAYQDGSSYTPGSVTGGTSTNYRNDMRIFGGTCLLVSTCAAPPALATTVTANTVDVVWSPGSTETSWNVYYRRSIDGVPFTLVDSNVTVTNYRFTGLEGGLQYEFKIEAVCSDRFASVVDVTTLCSEISSLPYTEDFNSWGTGTGTLPNCWFNTGTYGNYCYISSSFNHSGTNGGSVYLYQGTGADYSSYLVLPAIDTSIYSINQLQMVFYATYSSTSYAIPTYVVGVMSDPYDASSFVPVDTVQHSGVINQWDIFEVQLSNYTGRGANIALRTTYFSNYTYSYIDDITIEEIPSCQRPDHLAATNSTTTTVDLSWNERSGASEWIVEYGPVGFTLGTGIIVHATTNPFTLTGVPVAFQGEYYVRAVCSSSDTGDYSRMPCIFQTLQIPATIPYSYNFEDSTEFSNWQTSTNVSSINWYRGTAVADGGTHSMYVSTDRGATYRPYNSTQVVNAAIYRDIDFGDIDSSFTITFRARVGGTISANYDGLMVFLVDASLPAVASSSNITSPWGSVNDLYEVATVRRDTNWNTYVASFDTIHGIHRVAFFWFNQNTQSGYPNYGEPAAVDNITIDYSTCPRPVSLEADTFHITSSTARLTWRGPASAQYRVAYREAGAPASTNLYATTNTNSIVLSGLSPVTHYYAWVQKICGYDSSLFSDGVEFATHLCDYPEVAFDYDSTMSLSSSYYVPIGYSFYNYSYTQTIFDSAQMSAVTGPITAFAFLPTDVASGDYYTSCDVYMANVPEDNLSNGFIMPNITTHVFVKVMDNANLNFAETSWQTFGFDTVFTWDGHSNVLFVVNRRHGSYASPYSSFSTHTTSTVRTRYVYNDGTPYDPTTVTGGSTLYAAGDIQLISCAAGPTCAEPVITSVISDYESATFTWSGSSTDYEVNIKEVVALDWPAVDVPVTGNTYTFNALRSSTDYMFRVRTDCTADSNGYSEWVEYAFRTDSLPCFAPDSLDVTDVTNSHGTFSWQPRGNESIWDLHVWNTGGLDSVYRLTTIPATVGGFTAGVTYNAAVRPICGSLMVEGDYGDTITFTTSICPDVTGLTTSNVTSSSVTLHWEADPLAHSWIVEYGYNGFAQGTGSTVTATTNTYVVNDLEDETGYDFYVKAVCGDEWNSEGWTRVTATTLVRDDDSYTVTVTANDPTMGTVAGGGTYAGGQRCTVTATAYDGYEFVNWSNGQTDNPYTFVVTSDIVLQAIFRPTEGIDEVAHNVSCTIYPNPATKSTTVTLTGVNGKVNIAIINMDGRELVGETLECSADCEKKLMVENLAQGAYFVRVTGENVNIVKKLVVR